MKTKTLAAAILILAGFGFFYISMNSDNRNSFLTSNEAACPVYDSQTKTAAHGYSGTCPYTQANRAALIDAAVNAGCPGVVNKTVASACPAMSDCQTKDACCSSKTEAVVLVSNEIESSCCQGNAQIAALKSEPCCGQCL
jgi:hypothetical protein